MFIQFRQMQLVFDRLTSFLCMEEIVSNLRQLSTTPRKGQVILDNATFCWKQDDAVQPSSEVKYALKNVNFEARKGDLICIVGKVGSGKSTLLKSIMGELYLSIKSGCFNVQGSLAYCSQDAWIINSSIRENILFGKRYEKHFYDRTLEACQLQEDLKALSNGDNTVVGDKGVSLSGGQKARVSLARAIYARADIYLLDDVLSTADAFVGKKIIDHVLAPGGLLRSRTVILATNSSRALSKATTIYYMSKGEIIDHGTYGWLLEELKDFHEMLSDDDIREAGEEPKHLKCDPVHESLKLSTVVSRETIGSASKAPFAVDDTNLDGSTPHNIPETKQKGQVKKEVLLEYLKACRLPFIFLWALFIFLAIITGIYRTALLKEWSQKNLENGRNVQVSFYLIIYAVSGLGFTGLRLAGTYLLRAFCALNGAKTIHDKLSRSVVYSPMSFFDTTPMGRILSRFSGAIASLDSQVLPCFANLFEFSLLTAIQLATIVVALPVMLVIILVLSVLFSSYRLWYIQASRELKRLRATLNSPLISHFHESIGGSETIRAYDEVERFEFLSRKLIDNIAKVDIITQNVNNWLSLRLLSISAAVILACSLLCLSTLLSERPLSPGMVGFLLSYAISSTLMLDMIIKFSAESEVKLVSIERLLEYSNLPQEAPAIIEDNRPSESWPSKGSIDIKNYSTGYRDDLPAALKNINLRFEPSEKIGIVGRTGAGKSSLALALFRIIEARNGLIAIDGSSIDKMGLFDLRRRLNIIPQDTCAFRGSVRENLDPFGDYSDKELWRVLELAHLKSYVETLGATSKSTPDPNNSGQSSALDAGIQEGGSNLSSGERQLLCLVRALLSPSNVLVLDEATASVDAATDRIIQQTIRKEFKHKTIITIAHRLGTIMDSDKIVVVGDGQVKEFGPPKTLLNDSSSEFYALCKEAGLVSNKAE